MAKTTTISAKLSPLFAGEFELVATVPSDKPRVNYRNTVPISVHLCRNGPESSPLGAYVYSIVDTRGGESKTAKKVYQSLLNNSSDPLVDVAKRLGILLSRKYSVPSYVSVSDEIDLEEFVPVAKEVFNQIDAVYA